MKAVPILAACLLLGACNTVPGTAAPTLPPAARTDYLDLLARSRTGDTDAAFQIAQLYGNPAANPDAKGLARDPYEAALWCNLANAKSQNAYVEPCKALTQGLSPKLRGYAQAVAQAKLVQSYYGGSDGGGRGN